MQIGKFEILNTREVKKVLKLLHDQWGFQNPIEEAFLKKENDIFIISRAAGGIRMQNLNINSLGLYFGEIRHGQLRLSIEGSQIIGPSAKKNVLELAPQQLSKWLAGHDLEIERSDAPNAFFIVKNSKDFFGCGRMKEGTLLNFLPKSRRLTALNASQI